ncbi:MAG: AsnC family transcriptional regulator [Clostridium sp.]|nr:AsnC family transcriptional regulator [Clostridium sp.]
MKSAALNKLDPADRAILNIIQTRFPLVSRPYAAVAAEVGLTEAEVLTRVTALKEAGIIRRIGGIFASDKLGFSSTLVALKVAAEKIEAVALAVSAYPGVTHNYERAHEFNLWFTLVSRTETELEQVLNEIMCLDGVLKLRNLPALKLFKIGVNFDLTEEEPCC